MESIVEYKTKTREDLIGTTGQYTQNFKIIDAKEGKHGVDIRVQTDDGEEFWTSLDENGGKLSLDR